MKHINWYIFTIYLIMMLAIGFSVFDNAASSITFGLCVGGIFGWIFAYRK